MKTSLFCYLTNPGLKRPMAEILDDMREMAVEIDEAGWDIIWFAEHHFGHEGYDVTPNAILLSADVAARTKNIKVGQAANIITFWHPLRLAEDIAMLDHMTKGRLEVALGRGLYHREAVHLNPTADIRDDEQNRALFDETLEVMLKAWGEEFFQHKGRFYTFPEPGIVWDHGMSPKSPDYMNMETKELTKLSLQPRCYQHPHPPLWQVVDTPRSIRGAGEKGINAIMWQPTVPVLKERFGWYQEARSVAEARDVPLGHGLAVMRDLYIADTMEQAKEDAGQCINDLYQYVCYWRGLGNMLWLNEDLPPGGKLDPLSPGGSLEALTYDWQHPRNLLFGTADYVIEKIEEMKRELNLQHLVIHANPPGLAQDKVMKSLRAFNERVLPHLRTLGVKTEAAE
jgi:alkanesulfonate monooxygenase SsuD/methylene tetrahydromethanopterin reductase-like flavin-dependent oxidoreductase (luciferase family)